LIAAFVQQPWTTPALSTGAASTAPIAVPAPTRSIPDAAPITNLALFMGALLNGRSEVALKPVLSRGDFAR
jgi:hypothetical protein